MNPQTAARWRVLSRALKIIGVVGCFVTFGLPIGLARYYSTRRPHEPHPELGWTVGLTWTHPPSYGTPEEENRLHGAFDWYFPFFGVILLGEAVKIYKLNDHSGISPLRWPFNKS